jgi:hypothetical protein
LRAAEAVASAGSASRLIRFDCVVLGTPVGESLAPCARLSLPSPVGFGKAGRIAGHLAANDLLQTSPIFGFLAVAPHRDREDASGGTGGKELAGLVVAERRRKNRQEMASLAG